MHGALDVQVASDDGGFIVTTPPPVGIVPSWTDSAVLYWHRSSLLKSPNSRSDARLLFKCARCHHRVPNQLQLEQNKLTFGKELQAMLASLGVSVVFPAQIAKSSLRVETFFKACALAGNGLSRTAVGSVIPKLTIEQLTKAVQEAHECYNNIPLPILRVSPKIKFQEGLELYGSGTAPLLDPAAIEPLRLYAYADKVVKVTRADVKAFGLLYLASGLENHIGQPILARFDPRDVSQVLLMIDGDWRPAKVNWQGATQT